MLIHLPDEVRTVTATKEIILSAGAINSPHILLHSGIGDASLLSSLQIPVILDLPSVGKNLSDQPKFWGKWVVGANDTWDDIFRNNSYKEELLEQWRESRTGPLATSLASHVILSRLPGDSRILNQYGDPAAGPATPHLELLIQVLNVFDILHIPLSHLNLTLELLDYSDGYPA